MNYDKRLKSVLLNVFELLKQALVVVWKTRRLISIPYPQKTLCALPFWVCVCLVCFVQTHTQLKMKSLKKDILDQFPATMVIGSALQSYFCVVYKGSAQFPAVFTGFLPLVCSQDSAFVPGKPRSSQPVILFYSVFLFCAFSFLNECTYNNAIGILKVSCTYFVTFSDIH